MQLLLESGVNKDMVLQTMLSYRFPQQTCGEDGEAVRCCGLQLVVLGMEESAELGTGGRTSAINGARRRCTSLLSRIVMSSLAGQKPFSDVLILLAASRWNGKSIVAAHNADGICANHQI